MTTTTTRKTTPTTGPGANGRYKTKMERSLALLRENPDLSFAAFRIAYKIRYGEDPGARDSGFYRARIKLRNEALKLKTSNVAEHPKPIKPAPKTGQPAVATDSTWTASTEIPGGMAYVAVTKAPDGSRPLRRPASLDYLAGHGILMSVRTPILSLAASMGGLLALRRAVDELIGGLAPELREGAKP